MELSGKRVVVVGFGKTGEALVQFLHDRGARVTISEKKVKGELGKRAKKWEEKGVSLETGRHRLQTFLKADLVIPSPGAAALPELAVARRKGVMVLSELELAYHFLRGRIVGITGTNGKSTTASLAYKILKEAGQKAHLAGNIGTPLISFAQNNRDDYIYVTEISSFQLVYVDRFQAFLAVFLNISPNHLDWHGTFENYFAAKKKLILSQTKDAIVVLNRDDPLVWSLSKETKAKLYTFSQRFKVGRGCFVDAGSIFLRDGRDIKIMPADEITLPGSHNLDNVMAACLIAHAFGVPRAQMRRSIRSFSGLEHRLENVGRLGGVEFINDSKATTVDATVKAIQSFDKRIILILGGRDKGADFSLLRRPVREKVKKIILLGEAKEKIKHALHRTVPMVEVSTIRHAVRLAHESADPGEVVLLAPACTSFDMFKNFEARGRAFKREVRRLARKLKQERL